MAVATEPSVYLKARNLTVTFPLPPNVDMKSATVGGRIRQVGRRKELVAVDNVSMNLKPGDAVGLVGHNGSGKTTLLRALSGILYPHSGEVSYEGLRGNALNTSVGFRLEATGRHNIKLRALIAGMKREDVPNIIKDVEEFAQLGPFLDVPMHTYSAGMRARLAFGIATAFTYDILILDEWLGAGDRNMRDRVRDRMKDFVDRSSIIILATHSRTLMEAVCNKGIIMRHSKVEFEGAIKDVTATYDEMLDAEKAKA